MTDEKRPAKSGESRNRRRYFRRKAGEKRPEPAPPVRVRGGTRPDNKVEAASGGVERTQSTSRRRRRSKGRRSGAEARVEVAVAPIDINDNIALPPSIFIYTYTVLPDSKESYEFRSEHFSTVGRTLEDYNIDISSLFRQEESAASRIAAAFANMEPDDEDDAPARAPEPVESPKRQTKEKNK